METARTACPACDGTGARIVYRAPAVPVQSVRLMRDAGAARAFPTGDIALAFCRSCGFLWNAAFDPGLLDYGLDYEATQACSETFGAFHRDLAAELVARHGLAGRAVVEIGCGQGEFLELLCRAGAGRGIGIDPAYRPGAPDTPHGPRVEVHRAHLDERHAAIAGDLVCCKMTLEHIAAPAAFLALVGRSVAARAGSRLFFQVPDVTRILAEGAFWDVYYEHCSYFGPGSLARLFRRAGNRLLDLWTGYEGQYLMIEAEHDGAGDAAPLPAEESLESLTAAVEGFAARASAAIAAWRGFVEAETAAGRPVALWGGGSKAVAFLGALGLVAARVGAVVDINPRKQGCWLPGSGLQLVGPEALSDLRPGSVVVLNPVYRGEIAATLDALGLSPRLLTVESAPARALSP